MDTGYLYNTKQSYITISKYDYVRRCTNILLQKIFEIVAKQPSLNSLRCCAFFAPVMYCIIRWSPRAWSIQHILRYANEWVMQNYVMQNMATETKMTYTDTPINSDKHRLTHTYTHAHLRTYVRSKLSAQ